MGVVTLDQKRAEPQGLIFLPGTDWQYPATSGGPRSLAKEGYQERARPVFLAVADAHSPATQAGERARPWSKADPSRPALSDVPCR